MRTAVALAALACLLGADAVVAQELKQDSAVIRGRVTDATTGAPLRDVWVRLTTHEGFASETWADRTDKDGRYAFDVSPGHSPGHVSAGGLETHEAGWYGGLDLDYEDLPPEALVVFSAGDTVEVDVELQRLTVVHGALTDEQGRALPRVNVSATGPSGTGGGGSTDDEGRYSFRLHPRGGPVKLRFAEVAMDTTYVYEWFNDAADEESAWAIPIPTDDSLRIDATLRRGDWPVSLPVRTEDGNGVPVQGMEVTVWAGTGESRRVVATGETNARGGYVAASDLQASDAPFRVQVVDRAAHEHRRTPFESEWYADADSFDDATPLWLHAHTGNNSITFRLDPETGEAEPTQFVGGSVRDQHAEYVAGVEVLVHAEDLEDPATARTDQEGRWGVRVPTDLASVKIEYHAADPSRSDAEVVAWYENGSTREEATAVDLGGGDEHYVHVMLPILPAVVIEGTVVDRDRNPVPDIEVTGYWADVGLTEEEAELTFRARTDADGSFSARADGFAPEGLLVVFLEGAYGAGFHPIGDDDFEHALREIATPGLNSMLLFARFPTAALAGALTDETGRPLSGVEVVGWSGDADRQNPDSLVQVFEQRTSGKGRFVGLVQADRSPFFVRLDAGGRQVWFGGRDADGRLRWVRDRKLAHPIELLPGDSMAIDGIVSLPEQLAGGDDGRLDDIDTDARDPGDALGGGRGADAAGAGAASGDSGGPPNATDAAGSIDGEWVRLDSNNPRNDGMRVRVSGGTATLVYLPPSGSRKHSVGQVQWRGFSGAGSLQVRGSDGQLYPATASLEGDLVHIDVEANGPGNDQTWRRAGPSLRGEWVLVGPAGHPNDGVRIRVNGDEAEVTYVTASSDRNLRVGRVLWRDIGAADLRALTANGDYASASFELLDSDRLRVRVAGAAQFWARPSAAERMRAELADDGQEEAETPASDEAWSPRRGELSLRTLRADATLESGGDEPWLALVEFTFRLGEITWANYRPSPDISHAEDRNYLQEGATHVVEDASFAIEQIEPLTVFGLIPIVIEKDGDDEASRRRAARCMEAEVFAALRRLNDYEPDYADRSENNVANVTRLILDRMARLDRAIGASIHDSCQEEVSGQVLFRSSVAYRLQAPGISDTQLRSWINEGPGGDLAQDGETFELRVRAATNPVIGTAVPAAYTFVGQLRLSGP